VASKDIFLGFIDNHVRRLISAAPSQG
jgi:hypothetical protein